MKCTMRIEHLYASKCAVKNIVGCSCSESDQPPDLNTQCKLTPTSDVHKNYTKSWNEFSNCSHMHYVIGYSCPQVGLHQNNQSATYLNSNTQLKYAKTLHTLTLHQACSIILEKKRLETLCLLTFPAPLPTSYLPISQ